MAKILLKQSKTGAEVDIPRLNPSGAYRTLTAWITEDGNQQQQLEVLRKHVWKEAIGCSLLTTEEKQIAYLAFLRPQLAYPLGCTTIANTNLKRLFRLVLGTFLHTLGLNKNFH